MELDFEKLFWWKPWGHNMDGGTGLTRCLDNGLGDVDTLKQLKDIENQGFKLALGLA